MKKEKISAVINPNMEWLGAKLRNEPMLKKEIKNTSPKFYQNWSREQLIKELCRINQLLLDCLKIIKK